MVTLLHTADTHVGYRQYHRPEREADFRDAFYGVIDAAIAREVDAVVHAGDLFDSSRPGIDALSDALEGLKRLREANIPFLSIVGNHDGTRDRQWLDVFASLGLAIRLGDEGFSIRSEEDDGCHLALYGLDHVEPGKRDRLDYAFDPEKATEADAVVLVAHGLFEPFPNGDWDARAICRQSSIGLDAILAGDDHTNQETVLSEFGTLLTYPGSTERTAADQREPRGYDLVEISPTGEITLEFEALDTQQFVYVDVELDDGEGLDSVLDALAEREERETVEAATGSGETAGSGGSEGRGGDETESESGFADRVVVVTLTGAGERVSSGPIEEFGLARDALTVRVNDRREHSEELREYDEVAFADPERAVEGRLETLGLSENGREVEEIVRDTEGVPESNVTSVVETRVREWLDERSVETFERTEPADGEPMATSTGDDEGDSTTDPSPDLATTDPEGGRAIDPVGTADPKTSESGPNEAGSATDPEPGDTSEEGEPKTAEPDVAKATDGTEDDEEPGKPTETGASEPDRTEDDEKRDGRTTQATLWD